MRMTERKRDFARQLRQDQTAAEEKAWSLLRNNQIGGLKFRRQHVVEGFVVDFYCPRLKLAIELDGGVHDRKMNKDYDELRQIELESKGVAVLRFRNEQVMQDEKIIEKKILALAPWERAVKRKLMKNENRVRAVPVPGGEG